MQHWIIAAAAGITAACMVWDGMRYRLPNALIALLLVLWGAKVALVPGEHLGLALMAGGTALLLGLAMFAFRIVGAGDAKMLAVAYLWAGGMAQASIYTLWVGILGGVLSLGLILLRLMVRNWPILSLPRILQLRAPIPYGLAIGGGLLALWAGFAPMG